MSSKVNPIGCVADISRISDLETLYQIRDIVNANISRIIKNEEEEEVELRTKEEKELRILREEKKVQKIKNMKGISVVSFPGGRFKETKYGFILRDNFKVIGILNSEDKEDIRGLTSSEQAIARSMGLELE